MMKLQQFTVLVSLFLAVPLQIHGQCSSGTQFTQQYASCLSQFNTLTDFSKGPITGSQLNTYCSSSARTSEIQCAENIIKACKDSDETIRRIIEKTVNVNAIKGSVKILCNNTQIFTDQQDCIGRYQTTVTTCITNKYLSYNTKLQSLKSQALYRGVEWFEDKFYAELCDYVGEVSNCQRPYGRNCGREIGDVFDALAHAATPPVCTAVPSNPNLESGPTTKIPNKWFTSKIPNKGITSKIPNKGITSKIANKGFKEHVNLILLITLTCVALVEGKL